MIIICDDGNDHLQLWCFPLLGENDRGQWRGLVHWQSSLSTGTDHCFHSLFLSGIFVFFWSCCNSNICVSLVVIFDWQDYQHWSPGSPSEQQLSTKLGKIFLIFSRGDIFKSLLLLHFTLVLFYNNKNENSKLYIDYEKNPQYFQISFVTSRSVKAGEELTICYTSLMQVIIRNQDNSQWFLIDDDL